MGTKSKVLTDRNLSIPHKLSSHWEIIISNYQTKKTPKRAKPWELLKPLFGPVWSTSRQLWKEINTDVLRKWYFEMLNKQKFVIEETLPTRNVPDDFKIKEK